MRVLNTLELELFCRTLFPAYPLMYIPKNRLLFFSMPALTLLRIPSVFMISFKLCMPMILILKSYFNSSQSTKRISLNLKFTAETFQFNGCFSYGFRFHQWYCIHLTWSLHISSYSKGWIKIFQPPYPFSQL